MKIQELLSRLDKVKKSGPDRWVARCPAHDDKGPSLSIKATNETVLIHCFAGCGAEAVLGAVGMDFADLYPDHREQVKPQRLSAQDALRCIAFESVVVAASAGTMRQRQLTEQEIDRLIQASARIQAALDMAGARA